MSSDRYQPGRVFYEPGRVLKVLWRSWQYEITPAGKAVVGAGLVAAMGTVTVQIPIYMVFCALSSFFLLAMFTGFLLWPRVGLEGGFADKLESGRTVATTITVTNQSRWPVYDLAVGFFGLPHGVDQPDPEFVVPYVPGRGRVEIDVRLVFHRRGLVHLPALRAYTTFPFQLFRIGLSRLEVAPVLVTPAFHPLHHVDVPLSLRYQPGGITWSSNVGESPEYIGNREYVPGEPARRLDFRSWARLGRPVVREYQEEYYSRIALVLDTYAAAGGFLGRDPHGRSRGVGFRVQRSEHGYVFAPRWSPGHPGLEAAVSLVAAIADALSTGEHLIDLFAAGPELHVFRSGRHRAHFENVLEILACVGTSQTDPFQAVTPALVEEIGNVSAAVCVFLDWDRPRRKLAELVREAGCNLKVVVVRDAPTSLPLEEWDGEVAQVSVAQVTGGEVDAL